MLKPESSYVRAYRRPVSNDRAFIAALGSTVSRKANTDSHNFSHFSAGRLHASAITITEFGRIARASGRPIEDVQQALKVKLVPMAKAGQITGIISGFGFIGQYENLAAYFITSEQLEAERAAAIDFAAQEGGITLNSKQPHVTFGEVHLGGNSVIEPLAMRYLPDKPLRFNDMVIATSSGQIL